MPSTTNQLIDQFVSKLSKSGVPIWPEDNASRLKALEAHLPKRFPQSFTSLLARYSFPSFDAGGITYFGWESTGTEFSEIAPPAKGSLSELLLPAGYVQFGRPDTGSFDAVCFEVGTNQNREYRIVQADHEEILCNYRIKILGVLWPSFRKLVENWIALQ